MPRTGQLVAGNVLHVAVTADALTETWRATHASSTEQRSVRILRPEAHSYRRMLHDTLVAQRRLDHPNRLDLFDVTEVDGRLAVVTEWVNGPSLHTWARVRTREIDELLQVFAEVVDAIGVAHRAGLIHGALDSRRVWMRPTQGGFYPKVDFAVGDIATDLQLSPLRAPEQVTGDAIDARTDLYLLGVLLYEMVARHPPFEPGQPYLEPLSRSRSDVPAGLVHLVEALLEPDPGRRPSTTDEVRSRLIATMRGENADRYAPDPATATPSKVRVPQVGGGLESAWNRHQLALAVGAGLVGSVGTAVWLLLH